MNKSEKELLVSIDLFKNCREETVEKALSSPLTKVVEYKKGESMKADCASIGIITKGKIGIFRGSVRLNEKTIGDSFGYASLFGEENADNDDNAYDAASVTTIVAKSDCRVIYLPHDLTLDLLKYDSAFSENMFKIMCGRIRFLNSKLDSYTRQNTEEKVYSYLCSLPFDKNGNCIGVSGLSELARACCVGRATLYRILQSLEESGKIKRDKKNISVL